MRTTLIIIIYCLSTGCEDVDNKVLTSDRNFYEIKQQYSPDKTKLLLTYGTDEGATGKGEVGTAVLNLSDTLKKHSSFYNGMERIQ